MRGNQLHPPRSTKINIPAASAPRTHKLYHFPPPRVNRRAPLKLAQTPYICSEQIDVIENLLPRRWAADDIPVRANGDFFR